MTEVLTVGTPAIQVNLRRNKRAKRLTLRVSSVDGKPVLTLPARVSKRVARKFLAEQESWLRKQIDAAPQRVAVAVGVSIPFLGENLEIFQHSKSRTTLAPGHVLVPVNRPVGKSVQNFLVSRCRISVTEFSKQYAMLLHRRVGRISLRDPRSRWGSCSDEGNLMYSWRLMLAPQQVLKYVVVHEVAHLVEMNHSGAFWQVVADLMPDYSVHRAWLKQNGAALHRFDFKARLT